MYSSRGVCYVYINVCNFFLCAMQCRKIVLYVLYCICINKTWQLTEETTFVQTLFMSYARLWIANPCFKKTTNEAKVVGIMAMFVMQLVIIMLLHICNVQAVLTSVNTLIYVTKFTDLYWKYIHFKLSLKLASPFESSWISVIKANLLLNNETEFPYFPYYA